MPLTSVKNSDARCTLSDYFPAVHPSLPMQITFYVGCWYHDTYSPDEPRLALLK
ncbi:hypothetical protein BKA93DRAFT_789497 [Sparassis latifolia]